MSPITIRAKLLIQELWKELFERDEQLPQNVQGTWLEISKDIQESVKAAFPRCYFNEYKNTKTAKNTLHIFTDASLKAYGAVAYLCNGNESQIVIAKTKVAPLKPLTLPQLELMGIVIGARLASHLKYAFNDTIHEVEHLV